jgi:tyrosyl-tRNA synthetase
MYQFWLNADDADVINRLKVFTFLTRAEIAEFEVMVRDEPFKREAQRRLALEVTALVFSKAEALSARDASLALFGSGDLTALSEDSLRQALAELPSATVARGESVVAALVATGLCESNGAARRAIAQGAISINKIKIEAEDAVLSDFLAGGMAVLARGKKSLAGLFLAK